MSETKKTELENLSSNNSIFGVEFFDLSQSTQLSIIAEWIRREMWEKVKMFSQYIEPKLEMRVLDGLSFHEWLLTNQSDEAFEVWKIVRANAKNNNTYRSHFWADSAALLLYVNMPERLSSLDDEEWFGCINEHTLSSKGLRIKSHLSESLQDEFNGTKKLNTNDPLTRDVVIKDMLGIFSPMDLAFFRGNGDLMEKAARLNQFSHQDNSPEAAWYELIRSTKLYLKFNKNCSYKPLLRALEAIDITRNIETKNEESSLKVNIFREACRYLRLEEVKCFWKQLEQRDQEIFLCNNGFFNTLEFNELSEFLLFSKKLEVFEYIQSLSAEYYGDRDDCTFSSLKKCVDNGDYELVEYLIDRNPKWVDRTFNMALDIGSEKKNDSSAYDIKVKKSTLVVYSIMKKESAITNMLINKGASTTHIHDFLNCELVKKTEDYDCYSAIAEKAMLLSRVDKNNKNNTNNRNPIL